MKEKKYILVPGWIKSHTDGQQHYIGVRKLIELYGVKKSECVVPIRGTKEDIKTLIDQENLIPLFPKASGDYPLNTRSKSHGEQQKKKEFENMQPLSKPTQ